MINKSKRRRFEKINNTDKTMASLIKTNFSKQT